MQTLLLPFLETLLGYAPAIVLALAVSALGLRFVLRLRTTWGWRRRASAAAAARGISFEHYIAMAQGLVQSATGQPDPLPPLLVRRAICDEAFREQLVDTTTLLPIRRFWRPISAGAAPLMPPEILLAQICRRTFQAPPELDPQLSTRLALAWQLAAATNAAPTEAEVHQIIWDRRYRAAVLAAVDAGHGKAAPALTPIRRSATPGH